MAVRKGRVTLVKFMLDGGSATQALRDDALLSAVRWDRVKVVKVLLELGADRHASRALVYAVDIGQSAIVKLFVEKGIATQPSLGDSLLFATCRNHVDVAEVLLEGGADFNDTVVLLATLKGCTTVLNLMLEREAVQELRDRALLSASLKGDLAVVKVLLDLGANVHATDNAALIAAADEGHVDVVRALLDSGADIHANHDSALVAAVVRTQIGVICLLLDRGARLEVAEDFEAFSRAARGHRKRISKMLEVPRAELRRVTELMKRLRGL